MDSQLAQGLATLKLRATASSWVIFIYVIIWSVMAVGNLLELTGRIDMTAEVMDPTTTVFAFAYMLAFVVFIVSVVLTSMWIYRAHANLFAGGIADHEYTPGWAVGWFFISFANLVNPFQAMRDLWFASRGDRWVSTNTTPPILGWWWASWLIGNGLSNVGARMTERGLSQVGASCRLRRRSC